MTSAADPHDLQRFTDAQDGVFDQALGELRAGSKQSHWMWFVFPQIAGLGDSAMSRRYAIRSLDEARAYLDHPLLGPRLKLATETMLGWAGKRHCEAILGPVDSLKLRSSLTLFAEAAPNDPLFGGALIALFDSPDAKTLRLLGRA
jgi:uncharacterized protein (DUF1810 family)